MLELVKFRILLSTACLTAGFVGATSASEVAVSTPDFNRDIRPILSENCFQCHGPDEEARKAKLRLDTQQGLFEDRGDYHAVVPGDLDKSDLYYRITADDPDELMPPKESKKKLTDRQKGLIKRWIKSGAQWNKHWAHITPKRPNIPKAKISSYRTSNPIDHFIARKLKRAGLFQSKPADKRTLLRRVSLDLIGLPPTPAELDAFLDDRSARAYEKVVKRLLKSERYGERWARPWLDQARYADSNGFQADQLRPSWAYRDWVIEALNANMPFDQFTIEQLAGDLLPGATIKQKIATGFHRTVTCNVEAGVHAEENRVNQVVDRVNTTGTVWLGSTIECAQCHDHKFDPISTKDYYRLFAFFNNTPLEVQLPSGETDVSHDFVGPYMDLPVSEAARARTQVLEEQLKKLSAKLKRLKRDPEKGFDAWQEKAVIDADPEFAEIPEAIVKILKQPAKKRSTKNKDKLFAHYVKISPEVSKLSERIESITQERDDLKPDETLVMVEMEKPRITTVMNRGNYLDQGEEVKAGAPEFLHAFDSKLPRNRLGLAKWLVDKKNPLVARVTVNRWWAEFFGQGIVATVEDFGIQSEPPTHQDLLDWLAVEFMDSGWNMKHVLELIVTSETYKQDSRVSEEMLEKDPKNVFYARAPRFRLDAEGIRDNALMISGLLSTKMYGEPTMPYQPPGVWNQAGRGEPKWEEQENEDRWRRAIYIVYRRAAPYPSLVNFDAPDRATCTVKRARTNTPTQALTLLNDPSYIEMALALGDRILDEAPKENAASRIAYGISLVTGREARETEIAVLTLVLAQRKKMFSENPERAGVLVKGASRFYKARHKDINELAAWLYIGNILLNLDEAITKG